MSKKVIFMSKIDFHDGNNKYILKQLPERKIGDFNSKLGSSLHSICHETIFFL